MVSLAKKDSSGCKCGIDVKSVAIVLYQAALELLLRVMIFKRERATKSDLVRQVTAGLRRQNGRKKTGLNNTVINLTQLTIVPQKAFLGDLVAAEKALEETAIRETAERDFIFLVVLIDMMAA